MPNNRPSGNDQLSGSRIATSQQRGETSSQPAFIIPPEGTQSYRKEMKMRAGKQVRKEGLLPVGRVSNPSAEGQVLKPASRRLIGHVACPGNSPRGPTG